MEDFDYPIEAGPKLTLSTIDCHKRDNRKEIDAATIFSWCSELRRALN
jgi:hypothetical protein